MPLCKNMATTTDHTLNHIQNQLKMDHRPNVRPKNNLKKKTKWGREYKSETPGIQEIIITLGSVQAWTWEAGRDECTW